MLGLLLSGTPRPAGVDAYRITAAAGGAELRNPAQRLRASFTARGVEQLKTVAKEQRALARALAAFAGKLRRGRLSGVFAAPARGTLELTLSVGGKPVARGSKRFARAGRATVTLKPTGRLRSGAATLGARFVDSKGLSVTALKTVRLRK